MRTTVAIDDGLLNTARVRAESDRKTLGGVIEAALQVYFSWVEERSVQGPPLPVHAGGGLQPGVDLGSNASLHELMYAEEEATLRAQVAGRS